jgi:hemoglobin/transferrin/lactoferrin receptor protein
MLRTLGRAALIAATLAPVAIVGAQTRDTTQKPTPLGAVTITATRSERSTFDTPQPITVIDSATIREKLANGATDVFRDVAGLDVSGVGPNQRRPEIRGQRGQRILLLQDGLRLNNARRAQDFGELPALAGINTVSRVEVVRGPSSVLYGTDAIGGVVNLITAAPTASPDNVQASLTYRYGSAGKLGTPDAVVDARFGKFSARANVAYREAEDYVAPKGSFGNITLSDEYRVFDSGIRDRSYSLSTTYHLSPIRELFARAERYDADKAGFGFLDPAAFGPNQTRVQLFYPDQEYTRYSAGYRAKAMTNPFATRAEVTLYTQQNERDFNTAILAPAGPGATVDSKSYNFTDLRTLGGRVELARSFAERYTLTYGIDAFRDRSENTDSSRTVLTGFGPTPITQTSNTPTVPNATFRSGGAFAQLEANPFDRFTAIVGGRVQDVTAETRETPNVTTPLIKGTDRTGVWTANALYRVTPDVNLVTSVGRGFRAGNLVERFFEGRVTESNTQMKANPNLAAETSLNMDVGVRARRGIVYGEGFVFRNDIDNAIKSVPTGQTVNGRPEVQNQNVGKLRVDGLELVAGARALNGFETSASWTRILGRNITDPDSPIGDSYSSKVVGELEYRAPSGVFTAGYTARYQGEQKDVIVGTNPIGDVIPSFVVHSARASVRLPHRAGVSNRLLLSVENIGNKLYAEFPNASFFRPEPGRSVSLALTTSF